MKIKNPFKKFVREVLTEAGTAGLISGHSGRKGQDVDDFAAGPFFPDENVLKPLDQQVSETKFKRSQIPVFPEQKYKKSHIQIEYDSVPDYAGVEMTNDSNEMKTIDVDYGYDKVKPHMQMKHLLMIQMILKL